MNSNSQSVTIVPDEQGNAIRVSKTNAEYAHIRLVQQKVFFNTQGWVDNKSRSTLVHGKLEDLKAMGFEPGQELSGNIVIREQTEPFNSSNPDRDLKKAGDTGIICCAHGEPIYRRTFYDASGKEQDVLVAHTNGDAIREANGTDSKKTVTQEDLNKLMAKKDKKKAEKVEEVEEVVEQEVEMEEETFEL